VATGPLNDLGPSPVLPGDSVSSFTPESMLRNAEHSARCMPVIPAVGRLRLKDPEFEASLG
jgi:hypothetical protein